MRSHLHGHCVQIRLEAAEELTTALHFVTHSHREDCGAGFAMDRVDFLRKYHDIME